MYCILGALAFEGFDVSVRPGARGGRCGRARRALLLLYCLTALLRPSSLSVLLRVPLGHGVPKNARPRGVPSAPREARGASREPRCREKLGQGPRRGRRRAPDLPQMFFFVFELQGPWASLRARPRTTTTTTTTTSATAWQQHGPWQRHGNGMATARGTATARQRHGDGMETAWQRRAHGMASARQRHGIGSELPRRPLQVRAPIRPHHSQPIRQLRPARWLGGKNLGSSKSAIDQGTGRGWGSAPPTARMGGLLKRF